MSMLQELLKMVMNNDNEILEEDLGNLNFIDKKFKKVVLQDAEKKWDRHYNKASYTMKPGLNVKLGHDSIIKESTLKTAADIHKLLVDDELAYLQMLVLEVGGTQFAIIKKYSHTFPQLDKDDKTIITTPGVYRFEFFVDDDFLISHIKADSETLMSDALKKLVFKGPSEFDRLKGTETTVIAQTALYGQINVLMKVLKETDLGKDIKAHAVYQDTRRLVTHAERNNARRIDRYGKRNAFGDWEEGNMDPKNKIQLQRKPGESAKLSDQEVKDMKDAKGNNNDYYEQVHMQLKHRLDLFKLSKTPNIQEQEELIDIIKEKGFPKFIKVKGLTYKMYETSNMQMDYFTKKDPRHPPYVKYRLEEGNPEYEKAVKKLKLLRDMVEDPDNDPEYKRLFDKMKPLRNIIVTLKMGKGGIVPDKTVDEQAVW